MIDIGSIEYHNRPCLGDLNGDAVVNVTGILEFISAWESSNSSADIDGDGIVGVSDLLIVVGNWEPCE